MEREEHATGTGRVTTPEILETEQLVASVLDLGLVPLLFGPPGTGKSFTTDAIAADYERVVSLTVYPGTDDSVVQARVLEGHPPSTPWASGPIALAFESAVQRRTLLRISELQWGSPALFQYLAPVLEPARKLHLPSGETLRGPLDVVLETNDLGRLPQYLVDRCLVIEFHSWSADQLAALAIHHGVAAREARAIGIAVATHNRDCESEALLSARAIHKYALLRQRIEPRRAAEFAFRPSRGGRPDALLDAIGAVLP